MALSVQSTIGGPYWPLGYVNVANIGTPVCIMVNVDPANNNAPETPTSIKNPGLGTTPTAHKIFFQGFHPGANNNGLVFNSGNVYLLVSGVQGPGNRSDSGSMLMVIPPGSGATWPASELELDTLSPYRLFLDADVAGEGALVTLAI